MENALVVLQMKQNLNIDDPRNHSAERVGRLRQMLTAGAPARPEGNRPDFFEIEDGDQVFYIHLSPATGRVMLLATWVRETSSELSAAAEVASTKHLRQSHSCTNAVSQN